MKLSLVVYNHLLSYWFILSLEYFEFRIVAGSVDSSETSCFLCNPGEFSNTSGAFLLVSDTSRLFIIMILRKLCCWCGFRMVGAPTIQFSFVSRYIAFSCIANRACNSFVLELSTQHSQQSGSWCSRVNSFKYMKFQMNTFKYTTWYIMYLAGLRWAHDQVRGCARARVCVCMVFWRMIPSNRHLPRGALPLSPWSRAEANA